MEPLVLCSRPLRVLRVIFWLSHACCDMYPFLWLNHMPLNGDHTLSTGELLGCFHHLAVRKMPLRTFMYKFCVNTCFHFPWAHTRNGLTGSCGDSGFNLLRSCQTVFHSSCTILHPHQPCRRVPISLHSRQHLLRWVVLELSLITS